MKKRNFNRKPSQPLYVNAYSVGRYWGGPEEGGWYYDAGIPVLSFKIRRSERRHPGMTYEWQWGKRQDGRHVATAKVLILSRHRANQIKPEILKAIKAQIEEHFGYPEGMDRSGRGIGSVLSSNDELQIYFETHPGRAFPSERPHYE